VDFCTPILCGGVNHYDATPLIVALSPVQSDITWFRPLSPIVTENLLDRTEKFQNLEETSTVEDFDPRSGISGSISGEFLHVQIFMNDRLNQLT
jgi:hypothetical protein